MAKAVANQGKRQESYNLANLVDGTNNPPIRRPYESGIYSTLPNEGRGDRPQCLACISLGPRRTPTLYMRLASANSALCPNILSAL